MLQESGAAAELTVAETVRLWQALSIQRQDRLDVLALLELEHRASIRVKQLSGGERRRLDLALAVLTQPEVLFLDEPTTGLDPRSRRHTWHLVRELLAEGTTVLLTTHYLEEVEHLAHRVAIMHDGKIAVEGTLADVLATEPARISFALPDGTALADLPTLPSQLTCRSDNGLVELNTTNLQHDLSILLAWANDRDLTLPQLRANQASLEDVFHNVRTTTSLMEAAA